MDHFEIAKKWLLENNGVVNQKLERGVDENGIDGIFAKETIQANEVLVQVPHVLCLTPDKLEKYPLLNEFKLEKMMDKVVAIFLCEYEKVDDSIYQSWFDILPTLEEFKSFHPYFSNQEELESLNSLCPRVVETLKKFHHRVSSFMKETNGIFKLENIQWAYANYLTRAFENVGLVPFCDLFNHNEQKGMGIGDQQELNAKGMIEKGEQVFISYGSNYDSLELWMSFGFVDINAKPIISCGTLSFTPNSEVENKVASVFKEQDFKFIEKDGEISKIKFDARLNITGNGPSEQLMHACHLMGISHTHELEVEANPLKTLRKLNQLLNAFENEINLEALKFESKSSIIQSCQKLLKDRLNLIQKTRSWIKERAFEIVTS